MSSFSACKALVLAAPLLLAACSRAAPVSAPAAAPRDEPVAQDDAVAIDGAYTCDFRMGSEELAGACTIVQGTEGLRLRMALGPHSLQGALTTTTYGFRLQGRFNQEPVEVDFMRQGGRSFAAVLQLADRRLAKISIAPTDS